MSTPQEMVLEVDFVLAQVVTADNTVLDQVDRTYKFFCTKEESEKVFLLADVFKSVACMHRANEIKFEYEKTNTVELMLQDQPWTVRCTTWELKKKYPQSS